MIKTKEIRAARLQEVRVSEDGNTLTGYIARFNEQSDDLGYVEILAPGCFTSSLQGTPDIVALVNHDTNAPVGRTTAGTLQLSQDSNGLAYSLNLPNTTRANDLKESIKRGDIKGCSFGFFCTNDEWNDNVRTVKDVELIEVSVGVTFPAYPTTSSILRSLPASMPAELRSRVEAQFETREKPKTKHVDGEDLIADCFLIVGDPQDTSTWKLPYKFSTDEKTKSHLRNALARIDQVKGVSDEDLQKAKDKLADLCKQYDIDVNESKSVRSLTDQCTCTCPQCMAGSCGICSADPQCMGAERNSQRSTDDEWREVLMLRLRVAESE